MKKIMFFLVVLLNLVSQTNGQMEAKPDTTNVGAVLDVYLNCVSCDIQYLKENLKFLNFSRDPKTADVHIIVTSQATGSGGEKFMMEFAGRQRFAAIHDTVTFFTNADMTQFELREVMLEKLKAGLVPFLLKTSFAKNITVFFDDFKDTYQNEGTDKWHDWVFSIDFSGSASEEKAFSSIALSSGLYASKITSDIKLELYSDYNFMQSTYRFWDNDTLMECYVSTSKEYGLSGLFVVSLGDHAGVGCLGSVKSSSYNNLDLQIRFEPAFEFSFFKYSDASRRQLRFLYSIGYEHSDYNLPTIYNKTNDRLFRQNLNVGFSMLEKFGSIDAAIHGSNYLNNFSYFNLGADFRLNIKICRGFSVNASFTVEMPRNQISLPGAELTLNEQITGQQEMQTDYRFGGGIGLSYFFGSKNNNTVNPRFTF